MASSPDAVLERARPSVRQLAPYVPGARPSVEGEPFCRLASNENPLGPSPLAREALGKIGNLARYPDNDGHELKAALAAYHDCPIDCLMLGNGSSDLLDLIASAWLESSREAVFARHAFVVYPLVVQAAGANSRIAPAYPLEHEQPLGHDPDALREQVEESCSVVFLANPNNPTGTIITDEALREFLSTLPSHVLVVLDEAYAEYREPIPAAARFLDCPQVVLTRTFSKIYGLAGLRIGYAVAHSGVIDMLNRVRQPFNVNTLAQQAATAAIADSEHVARSREGCHDGMLRLLAAARELAMPALGTHGNFLTLQAGPQVNEAIAFLRERNILVRALPEYELPDWLRFTIGDTEQISTLIDALCAWRSQ